MMDTDVNNVLLTGELVRDPITRFASESGQQQTDFTMLIKESGVSGQAFQLFVPCQSYSQVATVADTLHRGETALVQGKLKWHSYTAKDGSKKSSLCVLARMVKRLSVVPIETEVSA